MAYEFTISDLIADPKVRAAFKRAERDQGFGFTVPAPKAPVLAGGAAVALELA